MAALIRSISTSRYQEALRELIEAKLRGLPMRARPAVTPPLVIDLMAALKRSLAEGVVAGADDELVCPGAADRDQSVGRRQQRGVHRVADIAAGWWTIIDAARPEE